MEWISVEDRLPDEGVDVLLWCGWAITGLIGNDNSFYTEDGVNPCHNVTHWMSLPEPPNDK